MPTPNFIGALAVLALLGAATPAARAQVGPVPARPGAGPPRPGPSQPGAQEVRSFVGTLVCYRADNDDQVYDAFDLKTNAGTELIRFPRHLGQALLAAARPGRHVTITALRDLDPLGHPGLRLVSLTAGSQTVLDAPPPRPIRPLTEASATVRGTVQRLARDPFGHTTTVILADGTVLRLPPAAAEQLADKLTVGTPIAATGVLRVPAPGEAVARPVRVLRAQTITLDGVQFFVQ